MCSHFIRSLPKPPITRTACEPDRQSKYSRRTWDPGWLEVWARSTAAWLSPRLCLSRMRPSRPSVAAGKSCTSGKRRLLSPGTSAVSLRSARHRVRAMRNTEQQRTCPSTAPQNAGVQDENSESRVPGPTLSESQLSEEDPYQQGNRGSEIWSLNLHERSSHTRGRESEAAAQTAGALRARDTELRSWDSCRSH